MVKQSARTVLPQDLTDLFFSVIKDGILVNFRGVNYELRAGQRRCVSVS